LVAGALVSKGLHVQAFGFRGEAIGIWKTVISLYGASEMPGLVDAVRRADIYLNNYYDDTRFLDWLGTAQEILERALKAKGILPREEAVGAFVRLVDRTLESTRAYAEYVIYMRQNPSHRGDWQDVQNMQSKTKNLLQDAPALLSYYLERRGVPRDLRPYLIEQFEHLVDRAKAEISLPSATASAAELSDADLAAFEAHSEAHPWKPRSGVSPSAFIESEFSEWLGRGLQRAHITRAQPKLAAAYATELRRDPSKRAKGLIEQPHKLPVGAARPVTARLVAELSDEEKLKRRAIERQNKARQRLRKRAKVQALEK